MEPKQHVARACSKAFIVKSQHKPFGLCLACCAEGVIKVACAFNSTPTLRRGGYMVARAFDSAFN